LDEPRYSAQKKFERRTPRGPKRGCGYFLRPAVWLETRANLIAMNFHVRGTPGGPLGGYRGGCWGGCRGGYHQFYARTTASDTCRPANTDAALQSAFPKSKQSFGRALQRQISGQANQRPDAIPGHVGSDVFISSERGAHRAISLKNGSSYWTAHAREDFVCPS